MSNLCCNDGVKTGPVLVIYGDSISTGAHGGGGYERSVMDALGASRVYNHAVGSSGLSLATPNSLVSLLERSDHLHPDADLILLWHGSNDWYWGAELGQFDDGNLHTFCGAMAHAVQRLRRASPKASLVFPTPIWRLEKPDRFAGDLEEAWTTPNQSGVTQRDIAECIIAGSYRFCFTAPDMRRRSQVHEGTAAVLLEDGVHPSAEGYQIISRVLISEMRNLCAV